MYSQRVILELVGLIYGAVGNPTHWPMFLERLGKVLNCTASTLFAQDLRSQELNIAAEIGIDPFFQRSYEAYYRTKNVYLMRGSHLLRSGTAYPSEALCPDHEALRSEFYNDWIAPQKQRHGMLGVIFKEQSLVSMIGEIRHRNARSFNNDDVALVQTLLPHLQRAISLDRRIACLEKQKAAATDALNRWSLGVILIDHRGRVLLMNRAAETILRQGDGVAVEADGLRAALPHESARLQNLIQGATRTGNGQSIHPGGAMPLSRSSSKRPLSILVTPLSSRQSVGSDGKAACAIFVSDPETAADTDEGLLQRLYGLTPAESRLAALLVQGKDVTHVSEELGVSLNTARTHLKRIFEKTNTRRQAEFVRLVLSAPVSSRLRN